MATTIVAQKKQVDAHKSENTQLLETNLESFQRLLLSEKISSGAKKSQIDNVPNKFIESAATVEYMIHK